MKQTGQKQLLFYMINFRKRNCNEIKLIVDLLLKEKREFIYLVRRIDSDRIHVSRYIPVRCSRCFTSNRPMKNS